MYSTGKRRLCARSLHLYTTTLIFSPQQSQFSVQGMRSDTSWDFILLQIENNKNLLKKNTWILWDIMKIKSKIA